MNLRKILTDAGCTIEDVNAVGQEVEDIGIHTVIVHKGLRYAVSAIGKSGDGKTLTMSFSPIKDDDSHDFGRHRMTLTHEE